MASRRSRLKAIANLPVRRKPASTQQEPENSKSLKPEDEKTDVSVVEAEVKEQETKKCKDGDNADKEDNSHDTSGDAPAQVEPEVLSPAVPLCESPAPQNVKSPLASRFGRRIKPSVSLNFLKERPPREKNDESSKHTEKPVEDENRQRVEDVNNVSLPSNHSKENVTESEAPSQDVSPITDVEKSQTEIVPQNEAVKNVSEVNETNVTEEKEDTPQPEIPSEHVNNETQGNQEESSDFNFKAPAYNVKRNIFANVMSPGPQSPHDTVSKQGNEESQNHNILFDFPFNELASHDNSQMQFNLTCGKRQLATFKPKKAKCNELARKVADARREFYRKYEKIPPDRSSLRMIDLIFYNPATNPMESKSKLERKDSCGFDEDLLNESKIDDPDAIFKKSESTFDKSKGEEYGRLPVPQVKIGLNGEIILDEKSLIIETTDAKKGREDLLNSVPIYEDRNSKTCYYKRKTQKTRDWSNLETKRFYKALNTIGTDFSLMQKYFPSRSRLELKNKFKREEKLNRNLIDKVLNNPAEFNITQFEKYIEATEKQIAEEEEEAERRMQRKLKMKKADRVRTKSSLLSREITESDENTAESDLSLISNNGMIKLNEKSKQVNEINLLCEKYSLRGMGESPGVQHPSPAIFFEVENNGNSLNAPSRVFTTVGVNELNNANKIRDAFDEIQTFNHMEKDISRKEALDGIETAGNFDECGELKNNSSGSVDEFYQAVVNLSASLKSDECKSIKSNRMGKRVRANVRRKDKKKGRKSARKSEDYPFMSTLDIETYESDCDNYSSSNESNDNSVVSTKTITDQDFIKLLAANAKNMKESKIQFQISEGCSLEKNVEIILDNVPSIALNEI